MRRSEYKEWAYRFTRATGIETKGNFALKKVSKKGEIVIEPITTRGAVALEIYNHIMKI